MSNTQPRAASPQKYKRVLLKISGEALMGNREYGMDPAMVAQIARDVAEVRTLGLDVCLVVGGGNIRSEERRGGTEGGRTHTSRVSPIHSKKKKTTTSNK